MKQLLLFFLLVPAIAGAQKLLPVTDSITYVIEQQDDTLRCQQDEIFLTTDCWVYDSCNYYNNSFSMPFTLKNATQHTLICNSYFTCWNDSGGISYADQLASGPLVLKPGQTATVRADILPYSRKQMKRIGRFLILADGTEHFIPLHIDCKPSEYRCSTSR